jgi:VWFA-related protein
MLRPACLFAGLLLISSPSFGQEGGGLQSSAPPDNTRPQSSTKAAPATPESRPVPTPPELPKLNGRADLVVVPVIVTNKAGEHASGLKKEAFQVEENGKVRNISFLEETKTERPVARNKDSAEEGYSNFVPGDEHLWRVTMVVLDMVNTPWMRQLEAKRQLINYLLRSAARDEPMVIFGLNSSGLHQLHSLTTDTKVLINALQKLKLSLSSEERTKPPEVFNDDPSAEQVSDEEQLMNDFMQDLSDSAAANYQRIATRQTLAAMTQLAHAFEAIPGRKTLIWATAGFPFTIDDPQSFARQGDDLRPEYEDAWRALDSANIAVYPVDLNELDFNTKNLPSANSGVSSRQLNNAKGINGLKSAVRLPYDEGSQQRLTLHAFADTTGGRACVTVDELERCFAEAVDDSRDYYLVGYYLGGDTQPGWRKLKVKVSGAGLRVRYRSGFYVAPKVEDSADMRRKQLVDALASPIPYSGLRLNARVVPPSPSNPPSTSSAGQKKPAEFMLEVMGDSLTIDREKSNAIDLEVITLTLDANHKNIGTAVQAITTELKAERVPNILQTGLGIPEKIDLPAGRCEVKFAVRDNLSGLIGTVSVPIETLK